MIAPLLAALLASAPALELAPAAARPGDAVLVRVLDAAADAAPTGALAGRALTFWRHDEEWRALEALPIETAPGTVPVRLQVGGSALSADLPVVEPGFRSKTLTLARKFVEPPAAARRRMAADRKAFARAFDRPFEPPLFRARFGWPRDDRTGGRFGDQRIINGEKRTVHYGLDLSGARGAPVAASDDGVVALTRDAYMSGKTVVLWHGAGVYTVYFHLDRIRVKEGERVTQGQRLGDLGSTGRSTGPHLHWGVKVGGLYVDPESILAIDFAQGTAPARRLPPPTETPDPMEVPATEASATAP